MSMNERGQQSKRDYNPRGVDHASFPRVCESCLGDTEFVRMIQDDLGGACKMCSRLYTIFKWRPGRGQGFKRTEVSLNTLCMNDQ